MILGRKSAGALVFVIQSLQEDPFFSYIFNSVAEASRNQLTKERAGMVLVGLDGLSSIELEATAKQDKKPDEAPTVLRRKASKFLGGDGTSHLVGIGFLSRDELVPEEEGRVSTGGIAYHFPKRESHFWHDDFNGLFAESE